MAVALGLLLPPPPTPKPPTARWLLPFWALLLLLFPPRGKKDEELAQLAEVITVLLVKGGEHAPSEIKIILLNGNPETQLICISYPETPLILSTLIVLSFFLVS